MPDQEEAHKLTEKQEKFCNEYLVDLNASGAARRAGYSENTAGAIGWENLKKHEIQSRISQLREITGKGFNITKERIAQELAMIAFGDTKILFDEYGKLKSPEQWNEEGRVVSSYEESETVFGDEEHGGIKTSKKAKQWDKIRAIEALTKLMGFNEPDKLLVKGLKILVTDKDADNE